MRKTNTKEIIFDAAIEIIAQVGFEKANMREIALSIGIKAASLYNHFDSKDKILQSIYAYFSEHFFDTFKTDAEIREIIKSGTRDDIASAFAFTFENDDAKKYRRLILISKIVYMRLFQDETAKGIFVELMTSEPQKRVMEWLNYGIKIGRIEEFDTSAFTFLLLASRHYLALTAFCNPNYEVKQLEIEKQLIKMIATILPLKI